MEEATYMQAVPRMTGAEYLPRRKGGIRGRHDRIRGDQQTHVCFSTTTTVTAWPKAFKCDA